MVDDNTGISVWESGANGDVDYGPYGDLESKVFYEEMIDLFTMIPLTLLGLTPEQVLC